MRRKGSTSTDPCHQRDVGHGQGLPRRRGRSQFPGAHLKSGPRRRKSQPKRRNQKRRRKSAKSHHRPLRPTRSLSLIKWWHSWLKPRWLTSRNIWSRLTAALTLNLKLGQCPFQQWKWAATEAHSFPVKETQSQHTFRT